MHFISIRRQIHQQIQPRIQIEIKEKNTTNTNTARRGVEEGGSCSAIRQVCSTLIWGHTLLSGTLLFLTNIFFRHSFYTNFASAHFAFRSTFLFHTRTLFQAHFLYTLAHVALSYTKLSFRETILFFTHLHSLCTLYLYSHFALPTSLFLHKSPILHVSCV